MQYRKTHEDPKTPVIEAEVPRGVLLPKGEEGEGFHVLNNVVLRELTGEEEDMLADGKKDVMANLYRVVSSCIMAISDGGDVVIDEPRKIRHMSNTHPGGFLMSDMLTLLFRLREVTVGDEFRQVVVCPMCEDDDGKKYSWTHIGSVSDLDILPVKGDPAEHTRTFVTSRDNVVKWTLMTAARHVELSKKQKQKDKATSALLMRVVSINDKEATPELLKRMSFRERNEIRKEFDCEGGIDTSLPVVCRNCGHEFSVDLEMGAQDFFFPSGE